jgi:hypothetical protein
VGVGFAGLDEGFFGEDVGDVVSEVEGERMGFFLGEPMVLRGECLSFQELTSLGLQKASRLWRVGSVGILVLGLEGETSFDFEGEAGGGVVRRSGVLCLGFAASRGGENRRIASRMSPS